MICNFANLRVFKPFWQEIYTKFSHEDIQALRFTKQYQTLRNNYIMTINRMKAYPSLFRARLPRG